MLEKILILHQIEPTATLPHKHQGNFSYWSGTPWVLHPCRWLLSWTIFQSPQTWQHALPPSNTPLLQGRQNMISATPFCFSSQIQPSMSSFLCILIESQSESSSPIFLYSSASHYWLTWPTTAGPSYYSWLHCILIRDLLPPFLSSSPIFSTIIFVPRLYNPSHISSSWLISSGLAKWEEHTLD